MKLIKLSERLNTVASFVRDGAFVADIGTDHAYIPIFLMQKGIAIGAVASDINEGPIMRARENIKSCGLQNEIITRVASGLDGIDDYAPSDIIISGMGGELIAEIIDKCEYVKNEKINLILQPMTSILELRSYLKNGFFIFNEELVSEDGKFYQIICARYDGKIHDYDDIELEIGRINIQKRGQAFSDFLELLITKKKKIALGMMQGGCDVESINIQIDELEKLR